MTFFEKIWIHLSMILRKIYYKMYYQSKLKIGRNVNWLHHFKILIGNNGKVKIGSNCFFNNYCSINSLGDITIGSDTLIGESVKIYDHNHKFNNQKEKIRNQGFSIGEVKIGNNCWIGSNAVILKGANIGNNCVIGAGCIISGSIASNTLVVMNRNLKIQQIRYKNKVIKH